MKIYTSFPQDLPPTALTIGTFDGVHLGHRARLEHMRSLSPHRTVLTFSNHPLSVLQGKSPPLLTPLPFKLSLLESLGIDAALVLPFDETLRSLPFEEVLSRIPLTHLVLSEGDAFGRDRQGHEKAVTRFAQERGFESLYLPKKSLGSAPISSSRIRALIEAGQLKEAESLLGRPHALFFPELQQAPAALPPDGVYPMFQGDRAAELTIQGRRCVSLIPFFREPFLVAFA